MKKIICFTGVVVLLVTTVCIVLVSIAYGNGSGEDDFILPSWGGGTIHCDPQLTDNIRLPVPTVNATINVGEVWYCDDFGGERWGTYGNGIAGNGRIAASSFGLYDARGSPLNENDNLIIYDYYGNRIWSCGWWNWMNLIFPESPRFREYEWSLNPSACGSVPMVDIHNRVIACDFKKIILVNASNHSNQPEWITYFPGGNWQSVPLSPTIVEDRTVIVPMSNGTLYAINVTNGQILATHSFKDNSSSVDFYAVRQMSWLDFFTILINYNCGFGDCPYRYNSVSHVVEWDSTVQYGIMPIPTDFFKDNIRFVTDREGTVAAVDMTNGSILAINSLGTPELITVDEMQFGTANSVCVKEKTVYIVTQFPSPNLRGNYIQNVTGRLYAIDVNPDADQSEILKENWSFSFQGQSAASPTLINNTIYFDAFNGKLSTLNGSGRDPRIYAVYTNGTLRWETHYDNITGFSFTMDPRGGFWFNDIGWLLHGGGGQKLVRFSEETGNITEEINITELLNDPDVYPFSCMVICGTEPETNLIMLVSVVHLYNQEGKWVIAINLSDNNKVLWKVPTESTLHMNYASGLYTILTENNEPRVLFGTCFGGVMAIGRYPNCRFYDDITYTTWDSPDDYNTFNDSVNVTFEIKTSVLQDRVMVRATLISKDHPNLNRYSTEKSYIITPTGIQDTMTISLPQYAPKGYYTLQLLLYNSTDGGSENDTYDSEEFYLYPLNDLPETPNQPWISNIINNLTMTFATNTTDPNGDNLWYKWRYDTSLGFTCYTPWIGPHESGEYCYKTISWLFPGTYQVQVRAKDNRLQPFVFTEWSEPYSVTITSNEGASVEWNSELLGQFTQTLLTPTQQTSCNGFAEGVSIQTQARESLNWNWSFGDGTYSEEQNITHQYDRLGSFIVNLSIKNIQGEFYNCTTTISVIPLKSMFKITGGQPETNISFTDTSTGIYYLTNWTWDFGDGNSSYQQNPLHAYTTPGIYNVSLTVKDDQNNMHVSNQTLYIESQAPCYVSVVDDSDIIGLGQDVIIGVDVFDDQSGINAVCINITFPDNETIGNFSMIKNMSQPYDYMFLFNDTWQVGIYNYSIWAVDYANNTNYSGGYQFSVSAQATIVIQTQRDSYTGNEYINITDPTMTFYSESCDGSILKSSSNYLTAWNALSSNNFGQFTIIDIGQKKYLSSYTVYRGFVYFNTSIIPTNATISNATLRLYKQNDNSATDFLITVQNGQPTYPHNPLQSTDYYRGYYSGNGGTFNTNSFGNGYNNLSLNSNGINWISKSGWTKLCLRSSRDINGNTPTGNEYVSVYTSEQGNSYTPKLTITYQNRSEIKNTGLTKIKGYLLIQVQYLDESHFPAIWKVDSDTVNETIPRTIPIADSGLGNDQSLDILFNGLVKASDLTHGTGTYRVYAAFRDSEGNILKTDRGIELESWWQFTKT